MASSPDLATLEKLLDDLFREPDELRRFIARLPDIGDLLHQLPGSTASLDALRFSAAEGLDARGLLGDEFFLRLREARPGKIAEIDVVAGRFRGRTVRRRRWRHATLAVLILGSAAFLLASQALRRAEEPVVPAVVRATTEQPREVAPAKEAALPPIHKQDPADREPAKTVEINYGSMNQVEMGQNGKLEINGIKGSR